MGILIVQRLVLATRLQDLLPHFIPVQQCSSKLQAVQLRLVCCADRDPASMLQPHSAFAIWCLSGTNHRELQTTTLSYPPCLLEQPAPPKPLNPGF